MGELAIAVDDQAQHVEELVVQDNAGTSAVAERHRHDPTAALLDPPHARSDVEAHELTHTLILLQVPAELHAIRR